MILAKIAIRINDILSLIGWDRKKIVIINIKWKKNTILIIFSKLKFLYNHYHSFALL